jgi:hypothetical protein
LPARSRPPAISVYVNLDALFPVDDRPDTAQDLREGLVLSGWTAGVLHRWVRSSTGQWIGVVTVLIATTTGGTYKASDQLVPAEALRPRDAAPGRGRRRPQG